MRVVCDSQFPMLFSGNTVRVVFLSFVTFMAMPVSLLLYVRQVLLVSAGSWTPCAWRRC